MNKKHWSMLGNVRRAEYKLKAMRKTQCICEHSRSWRKTKDRTLQHSMDCLQKMLIVKWKMFKVKMLNENVQSGLWMEQEVIWESRSLLQYISRRNWNIWQSVQFWQVGFSPICSHSEAIRLFWDCSLHTCKTGSLCVVFTLWYWTWCHLSPAIIVHRVWQSNCSALITATELLTDKQAVMHY